MLLPNDALQHTEQSIESSQSPTSPIRPISRPEPPADVFASASSTLRSDSPRVAPSAAPARETIAATLDVTALAQEPVSLEEEKEYELLDGNMLMVGN